MIRGCRLCPRRCDVDRPGGQRGACGVGEQAVMASSGAHFGEEPVLVGRGGSGTIFFAGCNLDCVFCQNHDISHSVDGRLVTPAEIAAAAVGLQRRGCENVNFVTPTHVSHAVAEAIVLARGHGCTVPTVYNCGGYESAETLRLMEGLIDVYMPDFKYADSPAGLRYSGVVDYAATATTALEEMYRQVGPLRLDGRGLACGGVLVRHLVMPGNLAASRDVIDIVARVAPGCTINVMGQYHPAYRAGEFQELAHPVDMGEIRTLRDYAFGRGLMRID